jgi:hypothetical protein
LGTSAGKCIALWILFAIVSLLFRELMRSESTPQSRTVCLLGYMRPLKYTMDRSLGGRLGPLRFIFNQGELRCSDAAEYST